MRKAIALLFLSVGSLSGIANAQTWSAVDTGTNGIVYALTTHNGHLYAGGDFTTAGGGDSVFGVAKWDGTTWSSLSDGMSIASGLPTVYSLASYNGDLYAAGVFEEAGDNICYNIARWDGADWLPVGLGREGLVKTLAVYNGALYVGGLFFDSTGSDKNYLAKWDGSTWSAVGTGVNNAVSSLTVYNNELYAGGLFTEAGGIPVSKIAKWNGTTWSAVGSGLSSVQVLRPHGAELFAGGMFTTAGGNPANNVARWNGSAWSAAGTGVGGVVLSLASYNGEMYAGGNYLKAGVNTVNSIARWNGTAWSSLGTGLKDYLGNSGFAYALEVYNGDLYVGGEFIDAGGVSADNIARWSTPAGVNTLYGSTSLVVYPNPTYGTFIVKTPESGTLVISNVQGQRIASFDLNKGETSLTLPDGVPPGIYLATYTSVKSGKSQVLRLVYGMDR